MDIINDLLWKKSVLGYSNTENQKKLIRAGKNYSMLATQQQHDFADF